MTYDEIKANMAELTDAMEAKGLTKSHATFEINVGAELNDTDVDLLWLHSVDLTENRCRFFCGPNAFDDAAQFISGLKSNT